MKGGVAEKKPSKLWKANKHVAGKRKKGFPAVKNPAPKIQNSNG